MKVSNGRVKLYTAKVLCTKVSSEVLNLICTYESNLEIKHKLTIYLKESCRFGSEQHFYFKYSLKNAKRVKVFLSFTGMNWLTHLCLEVPLSNVTCFQDTFENYSERGLQIKIYLRESFRLNCDEYFPFRDLRKFAFIRKIIPK